MNLNVNQELLKLANLSGLTISEELFKYALSSSFFKLINFIILNHFNLVSSKIV